MIAFASLFLGLVLGTQPVDLVVGDGVAAVELRLDGAVVQRLDGPPWSAPLDLGQELAPHVLEAVALDTEGRTLATARQWINLPTERAAISVVIEPPGDDGSRVARLAWESAAGAEPESVRVLLDGTPLNVDDPRRVILPPVDEQTLHLLQVEMQFEGRVAPRADVTFGGIYAEEVSTEMTALPLWATGKGKRGPSLAEVQDWFTVGDGKPLRVITVERGQAEAVFVMGRPFPRFFAPGEKVKIPKSLDIPKDLRLRFISPSPQENQGVARTFNLFPISPAYDRGVIDHVYGMLTGISGGDDENPPQIAPASAVAGLAAYEARQRRAVILVLPDVTDQSREAYGPSQVRGYMEHLRIPFYVWNPERRVADGLEGWDDIQPVGSMKDLAKAYEALLADLDRQWIVWIDGRHLPQDIELTAQAKGFTLSP